MCILYLMYFSDYTQWYFLIDGNQILSPSKEKLTISFTSGVNNIPKPTLGPKEMKQTQLFT